MSGEFARRKPAAHPHALRWFRSQRRRSRGPIWTQRAGHLRLDQADQGDPQGMHRAPRGYGGAVMNTLPDADLLAAYLDGRLAHTEVMALEERLRREPALADGLVILAREEAILSEWA